MYFLCIKSRGLLNTWFYIINTLTTFSHSFVGDAAVLQSYLEENTQGFMDILTSMATLNACFEAKKTAEASRQTSQAKYHRFIADNEIFLHGISSRCSTFLCQKVLETALERLWPISAPESVVEAAKLPKQVASEDHDTINYIGGAVVKKLKEKFKDKQDLNKVLTVFCGQKDQQDAPPQALTAMRDRGGLVYLTSDAFNIFLKMESIFLAGDYGAGDEKVDSFLEECSVH